MKVLFNSDLPNKPRLSVILLDWSVRESFHVLRYLNEQTVPRDQYEILWIEYYKREASSIRFALEQSQNDGKAPCVDQWILLEMPEDVYYHKHLLYNAGIVMSRGRITVICDSDVMVKPSFVESIVKEFEKDERIVLHLDEVRNVHKKFYPFNYPSFDEVTGKGCINWKDGKSTGLLDDSDILHTRNYGACMCALRRDLIEIGGADEHIDYLGHICGPYELTFRLVNSGKKEIWHPSEFLFHTWHPGADGASNYLGPHDGKNMSLAALEARRTGRTRPLVGNMAVRLLRNKDEVRYLPAEECLVPVSEIKRWRKKNLRRAFDPKFFLKNLIAKTRSQPGPLKHLILCLKLGFFMADLIFNQLRRKAQTWPGSSVMKKSILDKICLAYTFIWRNWNNNLYVLRNCDRILDELRREGTGHVALYGRGRLARILKTLIETTSIGFYGVYDSDSEEKLKNYKGKVIMTSLIDSPEDVRALRQIGLRSEDIVRIH